MAWRWTLPATSTSPIRGNNAIKEWNATTGQLTTLVSSGLNDPFGVAVDGAGNVYIADTGNNAIKEWKPRLEQVTTLVSSGLTNPYGVAVDGAGNVYFADYGNNASRSGTPRRTGHHPGLLRAE